MLSCDTYSLRNYLSDGKLDFLTVPAKLKELGIPGVTFNDIWMKSYDTPYLDQIKKACVDAGTAGDIELVGLRDEPIPHLIEELARRVAELVRESKDV